ncbi:MAG: flagellar basal body P-ring formation protein FlgA [Alphaproteobacteria bacterium]|nr:flagellar basal body P-ring formation protein FlgA [Alphaproteobacteria bacterium]
MSPFKNLKPKAYTLLAICIACLLVPHFAQAHTLNSNQIIVNENVVRLSDIFDVAGPFSDDKLFQAPPLGRKGVLSIENLEAIAIKYDLDWQNIHNYAKVTITRKARLIDYDAIKNIIADYAFGNQHLSGDANNTRINLTNQFNDITIAANDFAKFEISNFVYRPFNDQFSAKISYTIDDQRKSRQISGVIENMVNVPVLASNFRRDEIIKASDIKYIQLNSRRVAGNVMLNAEDIIGKSARNSIRAMLPLSESLLKYADLVKKNTIITLQFKVGRVELNIKARALTTGADGTIIRVLNLQSGKQIDAIVTGIDQAMTINSTKTNAKIASN